MVRPMFARVPQPPVSPDAMDETSARPRRIDWHALIARLQAERDLRCSLETDAQGPALATVLAEGSFDPQAAEMLFALAAGAAVSGDMPGRRFCPDELARMASDMAGGGPRLRNAKPSECNNPSHAAAPMAGLVRGLRREGPAKERVED